MVNRGPSPSKYLLPPVVGYHNHDVRLERRPAYTLGVRTTSSTQEIDVSPGPAQYLLTDVTRCGKSTQIAHHFGIRSSHKVISDTPAPNAYSLPDAKRLPMYSFGSRWNSEFGSNGNPSPAHYLLPSSFGGDDVTLKRAPKYSMVGRQPILMPQPFGPGPAEYLPNLDVCKKILPTIESRIEHEISSHTPAPNAYSLPDSRKYPAYSFGNRWNSEVDSNENPSPAHYQLPSSIGGDNVTSKRAPKYSMVSRQPILMSQSFGPGPAEYLPSSSNAYKILSTIKSRTQHDIFSDTPAPNAYSLPDFRKYPAHSFGNRWNSEVDSNGNPSPVHYQLPSSIGGDDVTSKRAPKYSMVGRQPILMSQSFGPGPAEYLPSSSNAYKILPTIKSRTQHDISSDTPAPNTYSLPDFRKYPAHSFGNRWNSEVNSDGNPSPVHYQLPSSIGGDDVTSKRAPKYTMVGRQPILMSQSLGPGPAEYLLNSSNACKILPTIKSRTQHDISSDTPAPNAYSLPDSRKYPAYSFGSRSNIEVDSNGNPSPAENLLPSSIGGDDVTSNRAPKCSMVGPQPILMSQSSGPGPAEYLPSSSNACKILPTIKSRTQHDISSDTPSPNAYSLPDAQKYPAYSFGSRSNIEVDSNGNPSPAHYHLPSSIGGEDTLKTAPIHSISNRHPIPSIQSFGPGPAASLPNLDTSKKLLPTLKSRTVREISPDTPASNRYFLQSYKPGVRSPSYTIGRRKSLLAGSTEC